MKWSRIIARLLFALTAHSSFVLMLLVLAVYIIPQFRSNWDRLDEPIPPITRLAAQFCSLIEGNRFLFWFAAVTIIMLDGFIYGALLRAYGRSAGFAWFIFFTIIEVVIVLFCVLAVFMWYIYNIYSIA